jgi:hypothetical protein
MQGVFKDHDVAFLCGFGAQAQVAVFKYANGPLIPPGVQQIYLTNNTWDIGKNYYGESAVLGDIQATLPLINDLVRKNPPAGAAERNEKLRQLDAERRLRWDQYLAQAMTQDEIWAVVIAEALRKTKSGPSSSQRRYARLSKNSAWRSSSSMYTRRFRILRPSSTSSRSGPKGLRRLATTA